MYDYIKGTLEELSPAEAVVECHGIGFKLQISLNTYDRLQGQKEVRLYVHHHLREDEETLYGFCDKEERRIFALLIGVSGIGPNTARMMLSSLTADEVSTAIASGDVNRIKGVKGIGLKTRPPRRSSSNSRTRFPGEERNSTYQEDRRQPIHRRHARPL